MGFNMSLSKYPNERNFREQVAFLAEYARLMHEYGAGTAGGASAFENPIEAILGEAESNLAAAIERLKALPIDNKLAMDEPDDLPAIRALRPDGPRRIWRAFDEDAYLDKLEGAMLARFAGCTLGAIVEGWSVEAMQKWAEYLNFPFPPTDYWPKAKSPGDFRYEVGRCDSYTSEKMDGVPVDDDVTYTILGLLIAERYGIDFTVADVGDAWLKLLPYACTAEDVALKNLKAGIPAERAADVNNPYCQWIGADIRSDPWAYLAPGWPEKAAEFAWRDAYLSHRRNGIFGEMYFSAAMSAAFAVDNAADALRAGLCEIPKNCMLYHDVVWALDESRNIRNYKDARAAVDERFAGMHHVHTQNNAALTIFGLIIGEGDVTRVLSEVIAMGMDNDCTAATAGSIAGAIAGKKNLAPHWYSRFNNKVYTYINGYPELAIDDVARRFAAVARKIHST